MAVNILVYKCYCVLVDDLYADYLQLEQTQGWSGPQH